MLLSAFRRWPIFLAVGFILSLATSTWAAPKISNVSPRGLQVGRSTTLVIDGSDLSADVQLVCDAQITSQTIKSGAKKGRVEIEVTLDSLVQPGIYALRLADGSGISGPVAVGVDRLVQRGFASELGELPAAFSGTAGPAQVLQAKLSGQKGQHLVVDVEAQRLGSGLKPVVRLVDTRGTQIAWSPPRGALGGDARLETTIPADAEYTIELHDELYRPAGPGFFRLKVGDLRYADLVLPLGVEAGSKQMMRFAAANFAAEAMLDATAAAVPGETAAPLPATGHFTGAAPRVAISDFPELLESPPVDGQLQSLPPAPVGVSGVLAAAGEEDKYRITVKPGQKLRLDCVARQFGSPLDGVLTIRKVDGSQLASGDDRPGSSDPLVDFTVPAGVTELQLALKDLLGGGGKDYVYRLVVRDLSRPDFSVSLTTDKIDVPAGGTQVIPVQVTRMNYDGPIELSLENQPTELALQGNTIPRGSNIGLLTLSAQSMPPSSRLSRLVGHAVDAQPAVARAALSPEVPGSRYQPRLRMELGLAITRPSPIGLTWVAGENDQLYLGGKMPAVVRLTRAEATAGKIRLKLLTSQPTPKKTVKEGNQEKTVDDPERTLRLEGDPVFGPEQKDVTVNVLVPADLPRQPWDVVLVAELLAADGKNVVSSLAAPVRTLSPVAPFTLELSGEAAAEGRAGSGEAGKLVGTIDRVASYQQPVLVTLENLPKGYTAPEVLVPGDQKQFELPLKFPFGSKTGELKGVKLVAVAAPLAAKSVKSNGIDVAIKVVAGEKPIAEQPKEIFEDDEKFVAMLTEGGGRAIPDQRDQYSGKYSMRVTPDQKFNAKLPSLGVKIRENPGPGEYRFLRFAWKKAQGNSICLQLAHDGKFGPTEGSGGRAGASFRYHAGPGAECFGASLQVADKTPARFEVVTRDLFHDFGEFTLTGLGFAPVDGQAALYDHIYLARQRDDFELLKVEK